MTKHKSYVCEDWINFADCFSVPLLRDDILGATLGGLWHRLRMAIIFAVRAGVKCTLINLASYVGREFPLRVRSPLVQRVPSLY